MSKETLSEPDRKLRILYLPAWYPHRKDDMAGLFVRKHAQAASLYNSIDVLFVKAESRLKKAVFLVQKSGEVNEYYLYYPAARNPFSKILRFLRYYHIGFARYKRENGKPDIVHVHILTRLAVIARLIRLRFGIPYVITEHWSRYYHKPFRNIFHRLVTRHVIRKAERIMPVSEDLASAMQGYGLKGHYTVVRNVVDDFFFLPSSPAPTPETKIIVHICCFDEPVKNNFGLIRAAEKLARIRSDFQIRFIGYGKDWESTRNYARQAKFRAGEIVFTGKLQPEQVVQEIQASCFMVLFSNYETASVVLCESLACGKPVIATRTGGIPEIINSSNGILVEPGKEDDLCAALNLMLDTHTGFDPIKIREAARQFSFSSIGRQLDSIYRSSIKKR